MQKLMTGLKKNSGYVSIETVIVAGLIIGLGAFSIASFQGSSTKVTDTALTQVENVQSTYDKLPK